VRLAFFDRLGRGMRSVSAIRWLTALGMAVAAGTLGLGVMLLLQARTDAWRQAEQASSNLVLALSRDIARNITLYDLSIQGLRDALARPDIDTISEETRRMAMFGRAASAEYLGTLVAMNPAGDVIANSNVDSRGQLNFADRESFRIHLDKTDAGLFISRPYRSRVRDGEPSIAISRRITLPDGSFGGVVAGSLRLAYFRNLFAKLNLGSAGSVTVFRSDGRVIMRRPFKTEDLDRDLGGTVSFRRYLEADSGTITGQAALDGVKRLYAFRHVPNLPLIVSVAVAVDDINAVWLHKAITIGSVLIILAGATVALCLLFRREIQRRMLAEDGLRSAAERLTVIAATDALTGIANRRAFEDRLAAEWRRSIRAETPIGLLILDADFFKRFNDGYGHPAGDDVLRAITACMTLHVARPGDTAARYGGEEFVALLSDTDEAGAMNVAERIRVAVAAMTLPHVGNPYGHVTVSIGVAVARPWLGVSQTSFLSLADAALYDAKHQGRNRCCMAGSDETARPACESLVLVQSC